MSTDATTDEPITTAPVTDIRTMQDLFALTKPDAPTPVDTEEAMLEARDPNKLGFPAMMPIELALKSNTPKEICEAYGITKEKFAQFVANPVFIKAYADAVESLKLNGMSFKVKAQMAAEEFLKTSFKMVTSPSTADSVRADLIKSTVRWAGWDAKAAEAGQGAQFAIQINLG